MFVGYKINLKTFLQGLWPSAWKESSDDVVNGESRSKFLIVGLGNPGREYGSNRHNVGFMAVDRLGDVHGVSLSRVQNKAVIGSGRIAGLSVILAKPQTFMNKSGDAAGPLANYYRIDPEQVLVVYDDLDLPLGTLRLRERGGAGGHKGVKSIIQHMGNDFPRLRLGIGRPPGRMPASAYVLQDFGEDEWPVVRDVLDRAVVAVETFLREGIELAMSRHNGSVVEND